MAVSGRRHSVDTRMVTTQAQLSPRAAAALGLVFTTAGLFILLFAVGVVPGAQQSLEAPRWVGVRAGLVFALCGVALIIGFALSAGAGPDG